MIERGGGVKDRGCESYKRERERYRERRRRRKRKRKGKGKGKRDSFRERGIKVLKRRRDKNISI